MTDPVDLVRRSLTPASREEFERRVATQAADLRQQVRNGELDNDDPTIGLELEAYLVDDGGNLQPVSREIFDDAPISRELGFHNIEVNTPATILDERGIRDQAQTIRDRFSRAHRAAESVGARPILDAMWTLPPEEGTRSYLSDVTERDGVVIAENMFESPRYYAIDNDILARSGGEIHLDLPGAEFQVPSILIESLTTSMQPHLQVPQATDFPRYYNVAIRTMGPVLALATNSPFLPADLYADGIASTILEETAHELRIPVFEQSINAGQDPGKVRFPADIDTPTDVIDRIVADQTTAPFLREWITDDPADADDYSDTFWELGHKHGTYWRWLRAVIGGDFVGEGNTERSLRIEYRPIPTQPSVDDIIGVQCLVVGLIHGLAIADHPLDTLDWKRARESFYNAVAEGPNATLHWVLETGDRTTESGEIFAEVFSYARRGLDERGISPSTIDRLLHPIEWRWETRTTPSQWKIDQVAAHLAEGDDLERAIQRMQATYLDIVGTPFVDWT